MRNELQRVRKKEEATEDHTNHNDILPKITNTHTHPNKSAHEVKEKLLLTIQIAFRVNCV